MTASPLRVGLIGCGNIAPSYLGRAPLFGGIEFVAVADLDMSRAEARAAEYGLRAQTVEALLAADDIDAVVNLTIPAAHAEVTSRILKAGKHAYSEKPLGVSVAEARAIADLAAETGLRVGCAPDTFLGGSHQTARALVDGGAIGRVTHGTCHVMSAGMEMWHPDPDFFFKPGAGPVLDIGPYYVAFLINILGPVAAVCAMSNSATPTRTITSEPRRGETITVETPTTVHAVLQFAEGAIVTLGASWDCHAHGHRNIELYGTEGSLYPRDPNFFGGPVTVASKTGEEAVHDGAEHPLSAPNRQAGHGEMVADYRSVGLADMAAAIAEGRDHRCSLERAVHATEVMEGILASGETGRFVAMTTTCTRPDAFGPEAARSLMRAPAPA